MDIPGYDFKVPFIEETFRIDGHWQPIDYTKDLFLKTYTVNEDGSITSEKPVSFDNEEDKEIENMANAFLASLGGEAKTWTEEDFLRICFRDITNGSFPMTGSLGVFKALIEMFNSEAKNKKFFEIFLEETKDIWEYHIEGKWENPPQPHILIYLLMYLIFDRILNESREINLDNLPTLFPLKYIKVEESERFNTDIKMFAYAFDNKAEEAIEEIMPSLQSLILLKDYLFLNSQIIAAAITSDDCRNTEGEEEKARQASMLGMQMVMSLNMNLGMMKEDKLVGELISFMEKSQKDSE